MMAAVRLPKRLAHFDGSQADALRAALSSGILIVPAFPAPTEEFLKWSDAVDDWTFARCKAGLASIVILEHRATERSVVRYEAWSDPRREIGETTAARLQALLDGLRSGDLLESESTTVVDGALLEIEWATVAIPTADAFRLAKNVADLDREICWPSHRAIAKVMLT